MSSVPSGTTPLGVHHNIHWVEKGKYSYKKGRKHWRKVNLSKGDHKTKKYIKRIAKLMKSISPRSYRKVKAAKGLPAKIFPNFLDKAYRD